MPYHSPDNIYWLFSSSAQAIAAFIGFLAAGFFFMYDRMDKLVQKDETLEEIYDEIKKGFYSRIRILFILTGSSIASSLFVVYMNGLNWPVFNSLLQLVVAALNLLTIYNAIAFVLFIIDPHKVKETADRLITTNKVLFSKPGGNPLELGEYMEKFIRLETLLRNIADYRLFLTKEPWEQRFNRSMPLMRLVRLLLERDIITKEEYRDIQTVSKARNLAVHGQTSGIEPNLGEIVDQLIVQLDGRLAH